MLHPEDTDVQAFALNHTGKSVVVTGDENRYAVYRLKDTSLQVRFSSWFKSVQESGCKEWEVCWA